MRELSLSGMCICLLVVAVFAAQGFALDLGNNKFVFIGSVAGDAKSGSYTINENSTEREFRLSAEQLRNYKDLRTALEQAAKADGPNQSIRFSGLWTNNGSEPDLGSLHVEIIDGAKDCPEKIYSKRVITGVYEGTEWGDFGHVTIREANGADMVLFGDGEEVFGQKTGIRVQANVQTAQEWLDTGDWGTCVISDFLLSGKRLK